MANLGRPPPITDPRFSDWLNDLWRYVKNPPTTTTTTTPSAGVLTVPNGGTGAQTLSGYIKGNGTSLFTAVGQIPWTDISNPPTFKVYGANVDALDNTSSTGIYALTSFGTSAVRTMTGTASRLTVTNGDGVSGNPTFDISTAYVGQNTITTLGTITTGVWTGTSIGTAYTDAKVKTVTGTANRLTIGGTSTDPTFDISASYVGQNTITTVGTVTTGTWNAGAVTSSKAVIGARVTVTYSASMTLDASLGNVFEITVTDGVAFTINAPTNPVTGQFLTVKIYNTSGGALGAATWNAVFKMNAWTQPADTFNRAICFHYNGTNWTEDFRSAADITN